MSSVWIQLLTGGLAAFVLTALATPLIRGAAMGAGKVTQVRSDRWHQRPTPTLGGVAIFLGFGLVVWITSSFTGQAPLLLSGSPRGILPLSPFEALVLASATAFLVGLVDDFLQLRPTAKLVGQLLAASILLTSGIGLWLTGIYLVDALLSLFWFVGITNAVNLLDNMDGLAGGVAFLASLFLAVIFLLEGTPELAALALALAGAILGFLVHNYPPAKIFMGDSGSLFLGMLLSGLALSPGAGLSRSLLAVMAVPALVLAVPILDTTLVTVSRVLEGRSPAEGGRDHSSHRLVSLGMSEERAVWVLWFLAFLAGSFGLLFRTSQRGFALMGGGVAVAVLALVGGYLLHIRFRHLSREGLKAPILYQRLLRLHKRFPVLLLALDGLLMALAYYGAYLIRWDAPQLAQELTYFRRSLPVVLAVKLLVFGSLQVYGEELGHYGLSEALRVLRANLMASVSVVAALLMLQRTGLSRGVVAIDFLLASAFTLGGRFSFRVMETWARRWSKEGVPAVLVGDLEEMDVVLAQMEKGRWPELRAVAVADRRAPQKQGRFRGYPLFGRGDAVQRAIGTTDARAVIIVEPETGEDGPAQGPPELVLEVEAEVEVFTLRVGLTLSNRGH